MPAIGFLEPRVPDAIPTGFAFREGFEAPDSRRRERGDCIRLAEVQMNVAGAGAELVRRRVSVMVTAGPPRPSRPRRQPKRSQSCS